MGWDGGQLLLITQLPAGGNYTSVENKIALTFNSAYSLYLKAYTTGLIEHSDSTIPAASAISFYLYL